MLDLKSFHIFFISVVIVLLAGLGTWALFNDYRSLGAVSLAVGVLVVVYFAYFARRTQIQ